MCFDLLVPSGQEVGIEDPGELVDRWGLKPPHCFTGCRVLHVFCVLGASSKGKYGEYYMYICLFSRSI